MFAKKIDAMRQMEIQIDIDVYRFIELSRVDFKESHNDILRRLFNLDAGKIEAERSFLKFRDKDNPKGRLYFSNPEVEERREEPPAPKMSEIGQIITGYYQQLMEKKGKTEEDKESVYWSYRGATLPEGTKLQKWLGGNRIDAEIRNGSIWVNEDQFQTPSSAAMAVNGGSNVNGWTFWEYFDEETKSWKKLDELRKNK